MKTKKEIREYIDRLIEYRKRLLANSEYSVIEITSVDTEITALRWVLSD